MKFKRLIQWVAFLSVALMMLGGCTKTAAEAPEEVIKQFKQVTKEIKAADFTGSLAMAGVDQGDEMNFNLNTEVKIDRQKEEVRKADVSLKVDGTLKAGEESMSGQVNFKFRMIGEDSYFNLMEFNSTDPNAEKYQALATPYLKKWQHLSSDFIPENIRTLQQKDEETLAKEEELKDLFIETKLFDVVKEFGIESLNGKKVYHYGVKLNKEGIKQYIRKAAVINGREMTEAEVEEATVFAETVTNMEMWIGVKDYYLYKGLVILSGQGLEEKGVTADVTLTYMANSYNQDLKIEPPADAEEFNPLSLLMGLQSSGMLDEGEEGVVGEEVEASIMEEDEVVEEEVGEEVAETKE